MATGEMTDSLSGSSGDRTTSSESAASSSDENFKTPRFKERLKRKKSKQKHKSSYHEFSAKHSHKQRFQKSHLSTHKKQKSCSRKKRIVEMFRHYYANFLLLLQMASKLIQAKLYSKELISEDYITAEESLVLKALKRTVTAEPDKVYVIIECLEEEISNDNGILKTIKESFCAQNLAKECSTDSIETNSSSSNERKCNLSSAKILRRKGSKRKYKSSHESSASSSGSSSNEGVASAKIVGCKGRKRNYKSCHNNPASSSSSPDYDFSHEKTRKKHKSSYQGKKLHVHVAQRKTSERHSTVKVFQKHYADVLKLLNTVSKQTLHQLYSKHLIPLDLISAERSRILKSLMNTVQVKPDTFFDIINCLQDELQPNGILQDIEEDLKDIELSHELTIERDEKSPVQRYKSFLQSLYNCSEVVMDDKLFISPCNKFIDLILLKKNGDFSGLEDQGEKVGSKVISLESITEPMNKSVLLIGESGMGKSTAAVEICRHWDDWRNLAKFRIVLLLKLRESRVQSMTKVRDLFYHRDKALSKAVANEALKSEGDSFLLIFDGFDELPESVVEDHNSLLMELIVGKCLPKSVRFITSRPKALYLKRKLFPKMQVVELQGFTEENGNKYLKVAFQLKPTLLKHLTDHVLTNPIFNFILTVPINCAILASIYEDMYKSVLLLPKTMTELYYKLVLVLIRRFLIEQGKLKPETKLVQSILELPNEILSRFNLVSKLAYHGYMEVKSIRVVFTDNDVGEGFCHLGLMNEFSELYVSEGVRKQYSFFHLSLQEFLAAWHALTCPSLDLQYLESILISGIRGRPDQSKPICLDYTGTIQGTLDMTYEPFIPFLFGHSRVVGNEELLKFLCDAILTSFGRMKRTTLGSIFECQKPELCVELGGMCQNITLCSRLDMYFFAYILQHSPCNWNVRAYCSFDMVETILNCPHSILGSVQTLDLQFLEYSGLQYLPLHNLQRFMFTVASPKQCQNASALVSKLSSLDSIDVKMKLSQKFSAITNDVFLRSIQNDYLLLRSCLSLASLRSLALTFYDLTKEGVRCLSQLISHKNLQEVELIMLNEDLTDYGITSQIFNPLLEDLCASTLISLKINFGHDILRYSLTKSVIKNVRVYFDDVDLLYKFISVLNPNLHQCSSKMNLEIRLTEFCETKLEMPKLGKALRCHCGYTEWHTRSKSLSVLDDFNEGDRYYSDGENSDDDSEDEYESTSQYSSSTSSCSLQNWNCYSDTVSVEERSWKQSCPDLMYIQEMSTLHPSLSKALETWSLYYSNASRFRGYNFK